jgi:putative hydrolase of the HAD superfamily
VINQKITTVIFDLDNVLFNEKLYIYFAYREIARFLSHHSNYSEDELFEKLEHDLEQKGTMYPRLFNDLLNDLGISENLIPEILRIYGCISAPIQLYPGAENLLAKLRQDGLKLGLATNGSVNTQRNKVRLLDIEKYFDTIVYARELGEKKEKPNPDVYRNTLEKLHVTSSESMYVGDNPYTDFVGARQIGLLTTRLLVGEFKEINLGKEYEADFQIYSLQGIDDLLKGLNGPLNIITSIQ